MGWVKIDDGFFRNPKVISVKKDARLLYVAALCYCHEHMTDGIVPIASLRVIGAEADVANPARHARELVNAGLWIARNDAEFWVNDYLDYNESSDERKAKQDAARERMKRTRSQNVRTNTPRTNSEVPPPLHQQEEDVEGEKDITGVTHVTPGDESPGDKSKDPVKQDDDKNEPDGKAAWKPSGPDHELVVWWADYSGAGMPGMFKPAVGAAAHLRKAGLKPEEAPALFDYCAGFQTGVSLQKMAGQYDAWRQSMATSKSSSPSPSGRIRTPPPPPERRPAAESKADLDAGVARFLGAGAGTRGES